MVKYEWDESNGVSVPTNKLMVIDADEYYVGMPLKKVDAETVAPTDGTPEYICLAQRNAGDEIRPLQIPVQEVFPDAVYTKIMEDGTEEKMKFGGGGGGKITPEQLPDGYPYEVKSYITIAEEQSATHKKTFLLSSVDGYYNNKGYLDGTKIIAGNTYIVYVDGVAYEGVAYEGVTESGYTRLCIFGPDNDIFPTAPINIVIGAGTRGTTCAVYFRDGGTHMVRVDLCERTLEKLDPKFLPEGYPYVEEGDKGSVEYNTGGNALYLEGFPPFDVGDTVNVKVDGVYYSLVAFDDDGYVTIGDSYNAIENGNGQYGWQIYREASHLVTNNFFSNDPHTVSWDFSKVIPMDEKFLPDGIGDVLNVLIIEPSNNSFTCNKTYNEIKEALLNNVPVMAIISIRYGHGEESPKQCIYQKVEYSNYDSAVYFSRGEDAVDLVLTSDNVVQSNAPM